MVEEQADHYLKDYKICFVLTISGVIRYFGIWRYTNMCYVVHMYGEYVHNPEYGKFIEVLLSDENNCRVIIEGVNHYLSTTIMWGTNTKVEWSSI